MHKILISRCLLGELVRYDGKSNPIDHQVLGQWQNEGRLVGICPEVAGGLSTPRPPAEIQKDGSIITIDGEDVTRQFNHGGEQALKLCRQHDIKIAILKQSSPSCGSTDIYNGDFDDTKIPGQGVTTALLRKHGIAVFCEKTLSDAIKHLKKLENLIA